MSAIVPIPSPELPPRRAVSLAERLDRERYASIWILGFVGLQIVCQLALLFESLSPLRVVWRVAAFSVSLAAIVLIPGLSRWHPSRWLALGALASITAGILHHRTSGPVAAVATLALYAAVLGPLFWVPRLTITTTVLQRLIFVIWAFHSLSALFGVLQTLYPGQFQPNVSSVILGQGVYAQGLKIQLADGTEVWRPMGLTDTPGGAAMSGLYATLFGMGYLVISRRGLMIALAAGGIAIGLFCMYLSQVRVVVVMSVFATLAFGIFLFILQRAQALMRLVSLLPVLAIASFFWASGVGGEKMTQRLTTLIEERPEEVYYSNRGIFLEYTFNELLPEHPLGAGLGRWGMISYYFGDDTNPLSTPLHAEIQWTAWVIDGGILLMGLYFFALVVAIIACAWQALRSTDHWYSAWAALVSAYGVAVLALTFSYVPFIGQAGMEFWLLNAATVTAGFYTRRRLA